MKRNRVVDFVNASNTVYRSVQDMSDAAELIASACFPELPGKVEVLTSPEWWLAGGVEVSIKGLDAPHKILKRFSIPAEILLSPSWVIQDYLIDNPPITLERP